MNKPLLLSSFLVFILSILLLPHLSKWSKLKVAEVADLLVTNAFIYTSDPSFPFANSMAIKNGRILGVGNYSVLQELEGSTTHKLNLEGKIVVPGFIDSHLHLLYGGLQQMMQVELHGVRTKQEFVMKIEAAVKSKREGIWVVGGGWNNDLWGGELPMANWIDDISPQNPVWLSRMDGHMGLANSLAIKMAGITKETKDPLGGTIVRWADGEPTGLLIDAAKKFILPSVPEPTIDERREALLRASNYALTKGVTTVVDMGRYVPGSSAELPWEDFTDVYKWANTSGNMIIRVCLFFPLETWSRLYDLVQKTGHVVSQWLYLGGVKAFLDGSLGSNSALFYEIEHAQHLAPGSATRFGKQGVVASVQPVHLLDDAISAEKKLGKERAEHGSYLFHSLLASHSLLAFGSDWPVADIDPLNNIRAAVTRIPPAWETPWIPSECLTLNNALDAGIRASYMPIFHGLQEFSVTFLFDCVVTCQYLWQDHLRIERGNLWMNWKGIERVNGRQLPPMGGSMILCHRRIYKVVDLLTC
ncbi:protein LONG AFTER FAR-RED 3 isoform X4 [Spinacia oleracea]|uniref:Protein LONG AFTER FAR-RED 3 isoform X4 n=1 Tax=Spinacia oleracea TaxID=3562 RepID=A0ABM3QY83_SPIOL|nr:protein LONG AFTER FAR-RED 3 isoform X4 [Spinacia oleracea]